ncbi:hypothetical protein Tcan_05006 [Toxocara canis]|uniref:DUF4440 domain-containing protein n=1 Tax=Toxocara canis TaxID=6265 RepID=A0A0B2VS80_TOXCA|nr:hypothetical protein Tcan_05006 [Toxocara canis]
MLSTVNLKVCGNYAGDRGRFVVKTKDGDKKGSYLIIWKKDGSSWKMASCCFNFRMQL